MLTGPDLLAKVRELDGASKSDLVRDCGYVSIKKDGSERLNYTAFYEALLEAKGMGFGAAASSKAGRKLSYETKVQFNGNLMVGKAYTAIAGIKPGDAYEIRLGRNGRIILAPIGAGPDGAGPDGAGDELGEGEEGTAAPVAASNGNGAAASVVTPQPAVAA